MATQLITPNPDIPAEEGMCLQYVRQTFGLPIRYGSATEAWNNSPSQHQDWNFPAGLWVPVWFSLVNEPNGHVALLAPDGSVYSTSDLKPNPVHHHPSLADLMSYYAYYGLPLTFLGWSEDVAGFPVVSLISVDSVPAPTPAPEQDWFDMADVNTLKDAVRSVLSEPDVLDMQAVYLLHRAIYLADPSGDTKAITGTTNLATKATWAAYLAAVNEKEHSGLKAELAELKALLTQLLPAAAPAEPVPATTN